MLYTYLAMEYGWIVFGIFILLVLYIVYTYVYFTAVVQRKALKLSARNTIGVDKMKTPNSGQYYYEAWINVQENFPHDTDNVLLNRHTYWALVLKGSKLSLQSGATVSSDGIIPTAGTEVLTFTENFPFQKWVQVCFSVDGGQVDAYLDGKLISTKSLNTALGKDTTNGLSYGNKYTIGEITNISFWPTTIDPQTVWNNYIQGSGQYNLFKYFKSYNVDLNIKKNTSDFYSQTIF